LKIIADAGGTTDAHVAGELHAGTLELTATAKNTATPTSTTVTVSGASGTVDLTQATVSGVTKAVVQNGADVQLTGAATMTATATNDALPSTTGVSVSAVGINVQEITSTVGGATAAGSTGGTTHAASVAATAHSTNKSTASVDFVGVTVFGGNGVEVT